jgi:hypothetical protein
MSDSSPSRRRLPRFTDRISLGDAGIRVSPYCVGQVGSPDTISAAFDTGINFFFLTADMHWPNYEATRNGLVRLLARSAHVRRQIVVGVAAYVTQREFCYQPFQEVLQAVPGLDTIDLVIAGGAYAGDFLTRLPIYQDHRRTGFVGARAVGASFHDRQAALLAVNHRMVDIAFVRYNPAHSGARTDLLPHLLRPKPAPLFNFTNTHGCFSPEQLNAFGLNGDVYWHPAVTDYYRFALTRPEIDGLLIAPRTPAELDGLRQALQRGPLDEEEEAYLVQLGLLRQGAALVDPDDRCEAVEPLTLLNQHERSKFDGTPQRPTAQASS